MLGPTESAILALLIALATFFVIRRSVTTYAADVVPRWWQVWR